MFRSVRWRGCEDVGRCAEECGESQCACMQFRDDKQLGTVVCLTPMMCVESRFFACNITQQKTTTVSQQQHDWWLSFFSPTAVASAAPAQAVVTGCSPFSTNSGSMNVVVKEIQQLQLQQVRPGSRCQCTHTSPHHHRMDTPTPIKLPPNHTHSSHHPYNPPSPQRPASATCASWPTLTTARPPCQTT